MLYALGFFVVLLIFAVFFITKSESKNKDIDKSFRSWGQTKGFKERPNPSLTRQTVLPTIPAKVINKNRYPRIVLENKPLTQQIIRWDTTNTLTIINSPDITASKNSLDDYLTITIRKDKQGKGVNVNPPNSMFKTGISYKKIHENIERTLKINNNSLLPSTVLPYTKIKYLIPVNPGVKPGNILVVETLYLEPDQHNQNIELLLEHASKLDKALTETINQNH